MVLDLEREVLHYKREGATTAIGIDVSFADIPDVDTMGLKHMHLVLLKATAKKATDDVGQ
jgi:hypothetical protein